MQTLLIKKTGSIVIVSNNIAHGMIESGIAVLTKKAFGTKEKAIEHAPKDKMVSNKSKNLRKK